MFRCQFERLSATEASPGQVVQGSQILAEISSFETVDQAEGAGFVGEPPECDGLERDLRFCGVDEPLPGDFFVHDRCFEGDDSPVESVGL
jgi:hypothetical protein